MADIFDTARLTRAIMELDEKLPRGEDMPDNAPRPAWCRIFCDTVDSPGGECCGICSTLSQITRETLDRVFGEES